jgi:GLEYA domain
MKATEAQQQAIANQALASSYDLQSAEGQELNTYLANKVVGFRWYAYNDYFEFNGPADSNATNKFLENIWNSKIMPFDSGLTNVIDMYSGVTDSGATYKITDQSTYMTMMFEFIFRPDVSGSWRFEVTSDDAAYLWINKLSEESTADPGIGYFSGTNKLILNKALISNGGLHGMISQLASITLEQNVEYRVRLVQGNNYGPQGIRLRVARPNNSLFVLRSDSSGVGAYDGNRLKSRYMVFDTYKTGMLCKVYRGYFWDSTNFFRNNKPMTAVRLKRAYNMNKDWLTTPGHGITMTASFADNPELITTSNHTSTNPTSTKTHALGTCCYPFNNTDTRSISFFGWFIPPDTGSYTFYFAGDDAIYLWMGKQSRERVRSGLSDSFDSDSGPNSAWVKIPGLHGTLSQPFSITLTKGVPIAMRIVQGDWGGGNTVVFGYKRPNGLIEYDLTKDFRF